MKKTYRIIGMMIVAVIAALSMTACSDDDDEDVADPATHDQALVGRWCSDFDDTYIKGTEYYIFNRNGKFESRIEYYAKENNEHIVFGTSGVWSTENSNNILTYTLNVNDSVLTYKYEYSISGNTLTLQNIENSVDRYTLTRR